MAQYTTNQEAMAQGAVKVEDATTQIQGHIQTLRSEVETMMGGWRGEAANAFVQVHDAFEQQATKIVTALGQMHESLVATSRTYGTNESDLQPMIQSRSGAAQESYLQCKKQWDDAAQALAQVLNTIGQAVGTAHDNYSQAERAAQSNWS